MNEPLDSQSKILIATQAINLCCHTIQATNELFKYLDSGSSEKQMAEYRAKCRRETDEYLSNIAQKISDIANEVGDYMNERDMVAEGPHLDFLSTTFNVLNENDDTE